IQSGVNAVHSVGSGPSPQWSLNCLKLAVASTTPAITKGLSWMTALSLTPIKEMIGRGSSSRHSLSGLITIGSGNPLLEAQSRPGCVPSHSMADLSSTLIVNASLVNSEQDGEACRFVQESMAVFNQRS